MNLLAAKEVIEKVDDIINPGEFLLVLLAKALESPDALYDMLQHEFGSDKVRFTSAQKGEPRLRTITDVIRYIGNTPQPHIQMDKITAMKILRDVGSIGLKDAKDIVESALSNLPLPSTLPKASEY